MAMMTAKYDGRCSACGGGIRAGEQIDYSAATKARHARCAGGSPKASPPRAAGGASDKQVSYAMRLMRERGYSTSGYLSAEHKRLGKRMRDKGTVEGWLRAKSSAELSELIDTLLAEGRAEQPTQQPDVTEAATPTQGTRGYPTSRPQADAVEISGRRDSRHDKRYEVGAVVAYDAKSATGAKYAVVLAARLWAPNEDAGHYTWTETAWVRPATDQEAAPLRASNARALAAPRVMRYLDRMVTAEGAERLDDAQARATLRGGIRWSWEAPTKPGGTNGRLAAMPELRTERVLVLEDGSVVGYHGGTYDSYIATGWRIAQPSEMLLSALAALTGADELLAKVSDVALEAGVE